MGWGSGNLGGGSGGLNFKVVAYETEGELLSATPNENTIGVVPVTTPITARVFSATEPQGLIDDAVWFLTGTNSPAAFNVLKAKKDAVMVYPMSAKQSVGGILVDVVAKSYIGRWVDWWNGELYDAGNEFESITGGWVAYDANPKEPVITRGDTSLKLKTTSSGYNVSIQTKNLIDMSEYSALNLSGDFKSTSNYGGWGLRDANGNQVAFTTSEHSIDLSTMDGLYRPFLQVRNTAEYFNMTKMQMVR